MTYFNLILFFSMTTVTYLINQARPISALVGGQVADPQHKITYQVAVVYKKNFNDQRKLACSAGIISKNKVLTIALCFMYNQFKLRYQYSILADTINWKLRGILKLIDQVFLPGGGHYYVNNIAIASLIDELNIDHPPNLNELDIPESYEAFYEELGTVSGYGHHIASISNSSNGGSNTQSDNMLRYADVLISHKAECLNEKVHIDTSKQLCGIMLNKRDWREAGLCENDEGSPLVINNKVIGLASQINYDCDDRFHGATYTKTSAFTLFIESIVNNNPLHGTIVLSNLRFTPHAASAA